MQKHTRVHAGSHDSADGSDPEFSSKTEMREEGGEVGEEINDKLDGKEDEHTDMIEEYRISLKKFMALSLFGRMYENILMLTAVFSCCQYIYSTYSQYIPESILADFSSLEIALAIVFTMDWCLNYFLADHKLMYFTDFYSMIDLLTVIPIWVIRAYPCMDYNAIVSSQDQIVYILCAITCTRILRSLRIRRKLMRIEDEVSRCIADIGLNIVVCLLFFAALMQFLESQDQAYEFHTWMYYILVTMATVGYGDIAPKSTLGRFMAMGMIAFAFISGPQMSSELLSKINEQSVYARAIYVKKYRSTHIYVCGEVSSMAVMEFVQELFHEDHEDENIQAVIMSPNAPTPTILNILRDPSLSLRVTYLEGSALSEKDLKRALVREARAIFIMTNKFAEDPDQEDAKTILQQFCLKKFVMRERSSVKPLFAIQLIRPENRRHLVDSSSIEGEKPKEDIVLCLNEIKMGIIAKAVMFPGSNTLLMNLLTSFADDDDDDDNAEDVEKETENLDNVEADNWVGEYQKGCGWEIYTTKLNPMFSGLAFALLADILYARCGIVMFALLMKDSARSRMLLNPADFVIPPYSEELEVEVFVVAENKNQSDLTFPNTGGDNDDSSNGAIQMARAAASLGVSFSNMSNWSSDGDKIKAKAAEMISKYGTAYAPQSKQKEAGAPKLQEWQQLLRKYDVASSSMSSQQELEKRLDEEYMKANFYTTIPLQPKLEDCTIHTSLEVEAPFVTQHTLIVGKKLSNLYDLILPLRACYLGFTRPVVILSPNPISKAIWSRISVFQGVYFIQGSILEELDIVRAGIFKASQCIVLADTEGNVQEAGLTAGAAATQAALQDSDAVFAYQAIKTMNPNISCCIEIINAANCAFLDPKEGLVSGDVDYKFTPQFASGVLLTSSLLDTLICQSLYNKSIVKIIELFGAGVDVKDKDAIMAQIMGKPFEAKKGLAAVVGSGMYQIKIPEGETRTYGELFKSMVKDGLIPLGLYRGVLKNMQVGPKGNKLPYVFTNPPKETELFSCDKVFVLSQKPIMGKRTLSKRTDWSLVRNLDMDPVDKLRRQLKQVEDLTNRRVDILDTKVEDVLSALREVSGKGKFDFEHAKEVEGHEEYRRMFDDRENGGGGGGGRLGLGSPGRSVRGRSGSPGRSFRGKKQLGQLGLQETADYPESPERDADLVPEA